MVQIIEGPGSRFQQFFNAFKPGLEQGTEKYLTEKRSRSQKDQENKALKSFGIDLEGVNDPVARSELIKQGLKNAENAKLYKALGLDIEGEEAGPSANQDRLLGGGPQSKGQQDQQEDYTPDQIKQALPLYKKLDANKRAILSIKHPQLANILERQSEFENKQNLAERRFGLEESKYGTQKEQFGQTHGLAERKAESQEKQFEKAHNLAQTKESRLGGEFEISQDLRERQFGLDAKKYDRMSDDEKAETLNKKFKENRDFEWKRAEPILKSAEDLRNNLEEKKTAANLIKQTAATGNVEGWGQWFADALGVEP